MTNENIDIDELIAQQDAEEAAQDFERPENAGFPDEKPENDNDSEPADDSVEATPSAVEAIIRVDPKVKEVTVFEYTVGRGEKLRHIAKRFGTTPAAIARSNHLVSPRHLVRGQVLTIKGKV